MPAGRVAGKAGYSNHYYNGEYRFNSIWYAISWSFVNFN